MTSAPQAPQFRIPAPQASTQEPAVQHVVRPTPGTFLRRRVLLVLGVLVLALTLVLTSDAISAEAGGLTPVSAGHVVMQPGETLWDVAVEHAPAGVDVRTYLLAVEQLNGVRAHSVAAWDVVLLPVIR